MDKKRIMLIDDQFAAPDDRKKYFERDYTSKLPYTFIYETGCIGELSSERIGSIEKAMGGVEKAGKIDLVLLDVMFPGDGNKYMGIAILKQIRHEYPILPIIMFTSLSRGEFKVFSESIENGANDFVGKGPDDFGQLKRTFQIWLTPDLKTEHSPNKPLYGNSEAIRLLRLKIGKIALNTEFRLKEPPTVLISGESGTGKEVIANMLWRLGPRSEGPFQVVLCTGLPRDLVESELFGHIKGAFTGADHEKEGLISQAKGGILFLDEIGDLSYGAQAKLLRAIQEKEIRKVGEVKSEYVDFQLIAATNKNLEDLVAKGQFREDLYYRITSGAIIHSPSLCDCMEDVPLFAEMFLKNLSKTGKEKLSPSAIRMFKKHSWPGNVREVGSVISRALLNLGSSNTIYPEDIIFESNIKNSQNIKNALMEQTEPKLLENSDDWSRIRILKEMKLAVEAKKKCKSIAEFMRKMYPKHTKTSTGALKDLIRRLTSGPWGDPDLRNDPELAGLLKELEDT
ncbi:sigma-54-dependent transcriptional regulator [Desulfobacula sp.]|uniref:Sigma-54-dependent Fis family transcriptional regulator n=1 Tax=Candidatus Desulfatibia vada TaxID=2841696 RepID=A0A8J6TQI7_9BACT|nr:sigma-54-dependent Fis family transcriptional regulator [Candidatus Desulfatibia vada]MBL6994167.1 sigma-54-dependent Fis family transcriptional regulator [Desulfobacula sp.]